MIKRFIIAFVLVVLVCGGIVGFNLFRDQAVEQFFATMQPLAMTVSTTTLEPVTWTPGIEAIGTVNAAQGVDLTVETTGIVKDVLFSANQRIEAGQTLVQLEDAMERADLAAARAQADLAKEAAERAEELRQRGAATQVAADIARATATNTAAQVERLQAVLSQKQVRAPFSGTIGIPRIEIGEYLAPGDVIATLQDLETMRVDFSIPEQRLGELAIGQPVLFGQSADETPYEGKIIGIEPKVDPVSRLVSVRAEIVNPDGRLRPGQFVRARVQLPQEHDVLAVPQTALVSSLYGDFVFVVEAAPAGSASPSPPTPGTAAASEAGDAGEAARPLVARQVFVKAARRADGLVEITDGLAPGQRVVTAGQNRLSDGAPVNVDNTVNPDPRGASGTATQ